MATLKTALLLLLLVTPLQGEVFAQSDAGGVAEDISITPSGTSDTGNDWFTLEKIEGIVDVGDFVVGPGRTELELAPGETFVAEISVTNRISDNRLFSLEVEDIAGSSDGSSAVDLISDGRGPYSIIDYLTFPSDSFRLELGERARIPVTITIPPDAEPGGFYGSVLVSTERIEEGGATGPRSPIIARVGSLFFVRVKGDALISGQTKDVSVIHDKAWHESGPINFAVAYENTGSVHVNPYGEISVTNMFGEQVGFIELEPWFVLPTSLRSREVIWNREYLLGRYKVTARINRGYDDIVDEVTTSFWVLPWKIVGGAFLIIFIVVFSIRAFFRTFEFKRKK